MADKSANKQDAPAGTGASRDAPGIIRVPQNSVAEVIDLCDDDSEYDRPSIHANRPFSLASADSGHADASSNKTPRKSRQSDDAFELKIEPVTAPSTARAPRPAVDKSGLTPKTLKFDDGLKQAARPPAASPETQPAELRETKESRRTSAIEDEIEIEALTQTQTSQPDVIDDALMKKSKNLAVDLEEDLEIEVLTAPQQTQEDVGAVSGREPVKPVSTIVLDSDLEIEPLKAPTISRQDSNTGHKSNIAKTTTLNKSRDEIEPRSALPKARSNINNGGQSKGSASSSKKKSASTLEEDLEIEPVFTQPHISNRGAAPAAHNASRTDFEFAVERRRARRRVPVSPHLFDQLFKRPEPGSAPPSPVNEADGFRRLSQTRMASSFDLDNTKEAAFMKARNILVDNVRLASLSPEPTDSPEAAEARSDPSEHNLSFLSIGRNAQSRVPPKVQHVPQDNQLKQLTSSSSEQLPQSLSEGFVPPERKGVRRRLSSEDEIIAVLNGSDSSGAAIDASSPPRRSARFGKSDVKMPRRTRRNIPKPTQLKQLFSCSSEESAESSSKEFLPPKRTSRVTLRRLSSDSETFDISDESESSGATIDSRSPPRRSQRLAGSSAPVVTRLRSRRKRPAPDTDSEIVPVVSHRDEEAPTTSLWRRALRARKDVVVASDDDKLSHRKRYAGRSNALIVDEDDDEDDDDDSIDLRGVPPSRHKRRRMLSLRDQVMTTDGDSDANITGRRRRSTRTPKRQLRVSATRKARARARVKYQKDGFIVNSSGESSYTPRKSGAPGGGSSDAGSNGDVSSTEEEENEPQGALWDKRRAEVRKALRGARAPFSAPIICCICQWDKSPVLGSMRHGWRNGYVQPASNFSAAVQRGDYGMRMTRPFCLGHTAGDQNGYVKRLESVARDNVRDIGPEALVGNRQAPKRRSKKKLKTGADAEHSDGWRDGDEESSSDDGFIVADKVTGKAKIQQVVCDVERTYLDVTLIDRNRVRALGAQYDSELRKHFVPVGVNIIPFEKWFEK